MTLNPAPAAMDDPCAAASDPAGGADAALEAALRRLDELRSEIGPAAFNLARAMITAAFAGWRAAHQGPFGAMPPSLADRVTLLEDAVRSLTARGPGNT
jgi:hypothetical protein